MRKKIHIDGPVEYKVSGYPEAVLFGVAALVVGVFKQSLNDIPVEKRAKAITALKEKLDTDIPKMLAEVRAGIIKN